MLVVGILSLVVRHCCLKTAEGKRMVVIMRNTPPNQMVLLAEMLRGLVVVREVDRGGYGWTTP